MRLNRICLLALLLAGCSGPESKPTSPNGMISGGANPNTSWAGRSAVVRWPPSNNEGMPQSLNSLPNGATRGP